MKTENPVLSYSLKQKENLTNYFSKEELDKVRDEAEKALNPKRFLHCQGVGSMLYNLERELGENTCYLLGYFHDITKDWSLEKQKDYINESHEMLYKGEENIPEAFHAISACILFKERYPKAPLIFSLALRHHTILSFDIRAELIFDLFTADKIERGRTYIDDNFRNFVLSKKTAEERAYEVLKLETEDLVKKGKTHLETTSLLFEDLKRKYG